jgi:hypothetical protein
MSLESGGCGGRNCTHAASYNWLPFFPIWAYIVAKQIKISY